MAIAEAGPAESPLFPIEAGIMPQKAATHATNSGKDTDKDVEAVGIG
jgi:hypothetical protein